MATVKKGTVKVGETDFRWSLFRQPPWTRDENQLPRLLGVAILVESLEPSRRELILEFEGVTTKEYEAVNKELGIDMESGKGDWPDGLVAHSAGLNDAGDLVVIEVWDTPEHQARFMEGRLGEALAKGGITGPPSSVTWIELVAHHYLGS